ncbi:MAG TPA: hypothetical protein VI542_12355 [Candidatus Tectomicrobia bacterium]
MDHYRYTRLEALAHLRDYVAEHGMVHIYDVHSVLLDMMPTDEDVRWAREIARKQRFVGMELACDPRYEQVLALDT